MLMTSTTYRTQSNKFKSDYFGLCSPLLATKIEDICCTSRVVTDYTGVLLYSNTGSFINALFSFFFLIKKLPPPSSPFFHLQLAKLF